MKTRFVNGLLTVVLLLLPGGSLADLSTGRAAFERGDYVQARELLLDPSLAKDGEALMMLARMAHEGQGGPVDEVAAYVFLTRIIMLGREEQMDEAVSTRLLVSTKMSHSDILSAEDRLARLVEGDWGRKALSEELVAATQDLRACPSRCVQQAQRLGALGPAARPAIPALEDIMTRDPYWLSRSSYVNALYSIGTAAVPALCRIAEDRAEFARSGPWNLTQVAYVLRAMGPAAAEARDCLIRAMAGLPAEPALAAEETRGEDAFNIMLREAEMAIALALIDIGDPDREAETSVRAAFHASEGFKAIMLSAVLGLTYKDIQPATDVSGNVLRTGDAEVKVLMLGLLAELSQQPGFAAQGAALRPVLTPLSEDADPALRMPARELLKIIGNG